jgi:twitching motility protein PilT
MDIAELLAFAVKNKASDLHLSAGLPPMIRVHGDVRRINLPPMEHRDVHGMIYDIMNDSQRKAYEESLECDFSFAIPGLARFRVNAFVQQRGAGAVMRTIPSKILTLEELKTPKIFAEITMQPRGLVLVTGPTGSGKSTTLAGMVNHINENLYGHILTVEDPIEFVHESKRCLINQREVGPQTLSFNNALRSALREDPDVILVGELRDLETIRLALTAAETGHLVFGTLHTSSAAKTIDRIVDVFPAAEKEMVRAMLSESLRAVISQTLAQDQGRQWPGRRARDHDRHAGDPQPDPRSQGRADECRDPDRRLGRHADARPVPDRPGAAQRDLDGRSPQRGPGQGQLPRLTGRYGDRSARRSTLLGFTRWNANRPRSSCTTCCKLMVASNGSDLFLTAEFPPAFKIDGKVTPVSSVPLTSAAHGGTRARADERPPGRPSSRRRRRSTSRSARPASGASGSTRSCSWAGWASCCGRSRARSRRSSSCSCRRILRDLSVTKRGLIIVVGATGSGKSNTLAAMIGYRNENTAGHIVTIEDPVEFVHPHKQCIITHREVGVDTENWEVALKNTLRQAPDVIMIGEIRERETMEHAVTFAETGHLCVATLHSNSANQALDRIINFFPEEKRQQLLMDLSLNVKAIISQRLIPMATGTGRMPAVEIMLNSPLIADLIFKGEVGLIKDIMKPRAASSACRPSTRICSCCTRTARSPTRTRFAMPTRSTTCV